MATRSWVNREYRRGLGTHPCGVLLLRVSVSEWDLAYPHQSSVQVQREMFSPRVLSLVTSLKGTMGLNAEL